MSWQDSYKMWENLDSVIQRTSLRDLRVNGQCFIRKEHKCEKIFGASKSCFIACPNEDEIQTVIALISEKLSRVGIEPIIAVQKRAYGQDIFCTKICGKIIEAKFCIVMLDDLIQESKNIPNPNVLGTPIILIPSIKSFISSCLKTNFAFNMVGFVSLFVGIFLSYPSIKCPGFAKGK